MSEPDKERHAKAIELDLNDPLKALREQFILSDNEVYLDGNSLGPMPKRVLHRLNQTLEHEWGRRLIRSWNEGWIELPQHAASKIAPLLGCGTPDVICADSVSVNLFKLAAASMGMDKHRTVILSVDDMFPTDLYIAQGLQKLMSPSACELKTTHIDRLNDALDETVNLVILSQVNFRTGEAYDLERITDLIHECGARVLWDVSHSAGVLPINVIDRSIDFAVGCGYKFLNGGPGAPAFMYVRPDLQPQLEQPLSGWMGHKDPFAFVNQYEPAQGMDQLLCGTPNILSLVALDEALDVYRSLKLQDIVDKAQGLAHFFASSVGASEELRAFNILSPPARGAQVTLEHEHAFAITQALIKQGIICDFRTPNFARFGFSPLYIRYVDVVSAIETLEAIVTSRTYLNPEFQDVKKVT